ncbi:MAG: response regulator [Opitutaceae bacterium]|nr:response regulator [Opitutaceae bacterium]
MDPTSHIIVVDDNQEIRELVARYLGSHGFRVSAVEGASSFYRLLERSAPDLVILDIMMPGEDGLSLCRQVRASGSLPIIFLTAAAEDTDRIVGLELGADDYLVKPFNPRELLARVRAVLRRTRNAQLQRSSLLADKVSFDNKQLHVSRREVVGPDGVAIPLSTSEFKLLCVFLERPGMVLTRDQLLDLTSGKAADVWDRSIDNQVSRLRRKIERDPRNPVLIATHWGGGYSFTGNAEGK